MNKPWYLPIYSLSQVETFIQLAENNNSIEIAKIIGSNKNGRVIMLEEVESCEEQFDPDYVKAVKLITKYFDDASSARFLDE